MCGPKINSLSSVTRDCEDSGCADSDCEFPLSLIGVCCDLLELSAISLDEVHLMNAVAVCCRSFYTTNSLQWQLASKRSSVRKATFNVSDAMDGKSFSEHHREQTEPRVSHSYSDAD